MIRVVAPHFVAGVVLVGGLVVRAAPIVRYMIGWHWTEVLAYCAREGWSA